MNARILMLFAFLAIFAGLGFSSTIVVNATTNCTASPEALNYSSINQAITAASAGDTIIICANDTAGYTENVLVNKALNIFGFNATGAVINAASALSSAFTVTAHGVNITNLTITGANNSAGTFVSGVYVTGENASIYNNTIYNNVYGVATYTGAAGARVFNNTIYSNLDTGIALHGTSSGSKAYNNILYQNNYYSIYSRTANNQIENNTIHINYPGASSSGMMLDSGSSNNIIYNNVIYDLYAGFQAQGSAYNNYTSNIVYNATYGFYTNSGGAYAILNSNAFYNSSYGMYLTNSGSSGLNFTSNILENNTYGAAAVALTTSPSELRFSGNRVFNNTYGFYLLDVTGQVYIYDNTQVLNNTYGVYLSSSSNANITNNDITNGYAGIYGQAASSNLLISNRIKGNETYGVVLTGSSSSNTVSGNNITGNGTVNSALFYMGSSTGSSFANNKLDNSSKGIVLVSSTLTMSGNNEIYNITSTGVEVYINVSSTLSTGGYNLTTDLMTFRLGSTTDVSIKVVDANVSLGVNWTNNTLTINVPNFDSGRGLNYTNGNYLALNVTSTGSGASVSPVLYYDTTAATTHNRVDMGRYVAQWVGLTETGSSGTVSATTTNMGYFMPVAYNSTAVSTVSSSGGGSSITYYTPTLAKTLDCASGALTVTVTYSGSALSGMTVNMFNTKYYSYVSAVTDSAGKAIFTVKADGNYELDTEKSGSYLAASLDAFDLVLCPSTVPVTTPVTPVTTPEVTPVTIPVTTPETTPEVTETGPTPLDNALTALAAADSAISTAVAEGKDVAAARAKIDEANAALSANNYELAVSLANQAAELAKNAAAKPPVVVAPVTSTTNTTSNGLDMGAILIGLVVVVILVLAVYFLTRGKNKTSKGHYKGHRRV